jgi:plasmid stabilization system protein ParE
MTYRVEIADQVDRDADAILEWLHSQHATDAAVAWFRGLGEAIDSLAQFRLFVQLNAALRRHRRL